VLSDFAKYNNKDFINALGDLLPQKMIDIVIRRSGIDERKKVNSITREERAALLDVIKHFRVSVSGFRPIKEAIVTKGGVAVREIDPKTMRSKLCEGLYFAGEVIDLDAYTGGYNLQIAFSTGVLAGESAAFDVLAKK
jgi:predicted Rossmann fold flavoprotein